MTPELASLLRGREERALVQRLLLETSPAVVQITLNIPGYPKRIEGDETAIRAAEKRLRESGIDIASRISMSNAAGLCLLLSSDAAASEVKLAAISMEDGIPFGRALDMDVITSSGPVSRADLGFGPRKCLICGNDAKFCARSGSHSTSELRARLKDILKLSL